MKKYKVTGASLTTHKGITFRNGDRVLENKLDEKVIPGLISDGVIVEFVPPVKEDAVASSEPLETPAPNDTPTPLKTKK